MWRFEHLGSVSKEPPGSRTCVSSVAVQPPPPTSTASAQPARSKAESAANQGENAPWLQSCSLCGERVIFERGSASSEWREM